MGMIRDAISKLGPFGFTTFEVMLGTEEFRELKEIVNFGEISEGELFEKKVEAHDITVRMFKQSEHIFDVSITKGREGILGFSLQDDYYPWH